MIYWIAIIGAALAFRTGYELGKWVERGRKGILPAATKEPQQ